jgi:hypothetical protein
LIGVLGALASLDIRERTRLKAFGVVTPAVIVGAGPALWMMTNGAYLDVSDLLPATLVFAVVACALLAYAVRACGPVASAQAVAMSVGVGASALVGLLWLQTHGWLYLTF